MTVAYRSIASAFGTDTATVTAPAGVVEDDLLVAVTVSPVQVDTPDITPPSGFTQVGSTYTDAAGDFEYRLWSKVATSSEPGSYAFTKSSTAFSHPVSAVVACYDGDGELAVDQVGWASYSNVITASDPVAPSITPTKPRSMLVVYSAAQVGSGTTYTAPSGMTERLDVQQSTDLRSGWFDETYNSLTATGTRTADSATDPNDWAAVAFNIYEINVPPNAATLTTLTGSEIIDRANTNRASHLFSDPDIGDSQSKFDHRYRLVGAGVWTTSTHVTPNLYVDFAGGTFAAGNYERQVLVYDALGLPAGGVGTEAWSASGFFTAADAPPDPTITSPINGSTIATNSGLVLWSSPAQTSYQVRKVADLAGVADTSTVYYDSGEVVSAAARSAAVTYPTNNRWEHIQVRIKSGGLWSSWASVRVEVDYTAPAIPTAVVVADTPDGAVTISATHPVPTGTEPSVTAFRVYRREGGSGDGAWITVNVAGAQVETVTPAGSGVDYAVKSGVAYSYRVEDLGANGTSSFSAWV